jgi:phospholipid/cholesterol/gamma-HCH transport system substrate-binding protein
MESRASYIMVGMFVVGLIAGAVFFALWLVSQGPDVPMNSYRVHFSGSVTGLEAGATVRYRGIPVGRVTRVDFHPQDTSIIEAFIEVNRRTPITTLTKARLEVQGLTGQPFIQLVESADLAEDREAERLQPTIENPRPVIPGEPSQLDQLFEEFPRAVRAFTELANELDRTLERNRDNIDTLLRSSASAADNLNGLISDARPLIGDVRAAVPDARQALRAFTGTNTQVQAFLQENRRPFNDFASTGLYELTQFLTDTRQFLRTSTRILRQLESDPSRFLFGNRQEGYRPQ